MAARYCDTENGEEIGWLMSPILEGFYYGFLETRETRWIDHLIDWTDAWVSRAVQEPDGYIGWPKLGAAGTDVDGLNTYFADSLLGEAMALRPITLMAATILKTPALSVRYGGKAAGYVQLAHTTFEKWRNRGAWRSTPRGAISIVLPFGINRARWAWTAGYEQRMALDQGFSHPNNKANLVAMWLMALYDATGDPACRQLAQSWFKLLNTRMKPDASGKYEIWNYWQPAGPWDFRSDGSVKHWVGRHPNLGYYAIDVRAVMAAHRHGLGFNLNDIMRLARTAKSRQLFWPPLAPYDERSRLAVEARIEIGGWSTLSTAPWYLALREHTLTCRSELNAH